MSKQWTIENDTGAELTVRAPSGFAVELDANSADPRERFAYFAIRQQARDLDQLRADLAAAVAERDRLIAELPLSTGRDVNETRKRLGPITRIADGPSERAYVCATTAREVVGYVIAERDSAKLRAEKAEAKVRALRGEVAQLCGYDSSDEMDAATMTVGAKWPKGI